MGRARGTEEVKKSRFFLLSLELVPQVPQVPPLPSVALANTARTATSLSSFFTIATGCNC